MFNGERCQVCVVHQIATNSGVRKQKTARTPPMTFGRLRYPNRLAGEPISPPARHAASIESGCSIDTRIGRNPRETQEGFPRQSNARRRRELLLQARGAPRRCCAETVEGRIDEQVDVNDDHLKSSPSASASASATLSIGIESSPTVERLHSKRFARPGRLHFDAVLPCRRALLTTSFRLVSRSRRKRSSRTATSSSIVRVVRICIKT